MREVFSGQVNTYINYQNFPFMKFPIGVLDTDKYHIEIDALLADKDCALIFDTNLFSQLFKIFPTARKEFYSWIDDRIVEKRVAIPNWAVNEYTRRYITNRLADYVGEHAKLKNVGDDLQRMESFLKMYVDDDMLKGTSYSSKAAYFTDWDNIISCLKKVTSAIRPVTDYISELNDEIRDRFGKVVMESNIHSISSSIFYEAEARRENQVPPGFEDGKKDNNKYGDLVIWKEILLHCEKRGIKKAILITNDGKKDWVYKPQKRTFHTKIINNEDYQLADPRLVDEFYSATSSEEFWIINFSTVVQSLWSKHNDKFKFLAEAIQTKGSTEAVAAKTGGATPIIDPLQVDKHGGQDASNSQTSVIDSPVDSEMYSPDALADKSYITKNAYLNPVLTGLRSYSWEIQNTALEGLNPGLVNLLIVNQDTKDDLFVIGRNIYQAACGNAFEAIKFLNDLAYQQRAFYLPLVTHIVNGIFYEIYFDSSGELRRGNFKTTMLSNVWSLEDTTLYKDSIEFICKALSPFAKTGVFQPQHPRARYVIEIVGESAADADGEPAYKIISINHSGTSLLTKRDYIYNEWMEPTNTSLSRKEFIKKIVDKFGAPTERIDFVAESEFHKSNLFVLPEDFDIGR